MISRKLLKIHRWWMSHYGTMVAFIYVVVAASPTPPTLRTLLWTLGVFTVASLGIGTFGQLLNDLADVEQDTRSKSHNLVASRGPFARIAIFAIALGVGLVPWIWLPTTPAIIALIAAEYTLFSAYSLPPVRLKSRGILGPIADALYGYVIPNAVAVLVFAEVGGVAVPVWAMAVFIVWCLLFGFERIVFHQLCDEPRDRIDGISTFVVAKGWRQAFDVLLRVVVPLETIAFIVLIAMLGMVAPLIPISFGVYLVAALSAWSYRSHWNTWRLDRLPPIDRHYLVADVVIARFTWRWLPLATLATLLMRQPGLLPLGLLHAVLFPEPFIWLWRQGIPEARRRGHREGAGGADGAPRLSEPLPARTLHEAARSQ